ncbi:alpha/beta hydrolase [Achromobacter xylosoxidans]
MEQPPYGIKDEALRARVVSQMHAGDSAASGLPGNPWWSVVEMHKLARSVLRNMPALRAPCLVMHARNDDIASVSNAYEIQRRAVNAPVTLQLLDDSYHMITIDRERRVVIARGGPS